MAIDKWARRFRYWRRPLSKTEFSRFKQTLSLILEALRESPILEAYDYKVRIYGSYRNRTNLRALSDIDVYVICKPPRPRFPFWRKLAQRTIYRWVAPPWYSAFKDQIHWALKEKFDFDSGSYVEAVERRNKVIGIRKTADRAGADVLVCVQRGTGSAEIEFWPDRSKRIVSWPEGHHRQAAALNRKTRRRYKTLVRLLKGMRHRLIKRKIRGPEKVSSYMIECLVRNVPKNYYDADDYMTNLRDTLSYLRRGLNSLRQWPRWWEVNEKQRMARLLRKRHKAVCQFIDAAWADLGFEPVER